MAEAVEWALETGLLLGVEPDRLSPGETASRAQLAVILTRWRGQSATA